VPRARGARAIAEVNDLIDQRVDPEPTDAPRAPSRPHGRPLAERQTPHALRPTELHHADDLLMQARRRQIDSSLVAQEVIRTSGPDDRAPAYRG
jgi:hypothetical protein